MKTCLISGLLLLTLSLGHAQNYQEEFGKSFQKKDTISQREILKKWEKENPNDPELFTSYFNFYFIKSRMEVVTLSQEKPAGEGMAIQDKTGKTAGYLGSQSMFNRDTIQKGIDKIEEGIRLYPDRLDMRFGKIYVYGELKEWSLFTEEIVRSVQHSSQNKNNWTWTNNEPKGGEDFFLGNLQNYQSQLYNTGDDQLLSNMGTIAREILKYYPEHVESLSNLSITYFFTKEFDKAIAALLKAEKIRPNDPIVLANIAHGYKLKGDKKMSIAYYEKMIIHGDQRMKDFAKQQIEELKK